MKSRRLALQLQERLRFLQAKGGGQESVVANLRVKIERKMNAVEREVVLERQSQSAIKRPGDGSQPRPEQPVVHNEQIDLALDRQLKCKSRRRRRRRFSSTSPAFSICSPLSAFG